MSSDDTGAHVSSNRVQGELSDAPLEKLLDDCHRFLITGSIRVVTPSGEGAIVLRAGAVDEATWDNLTGHAAADEMKTLRQGTYYLVQRLPNLDGALGDAAECVGNLEEFSLVEIMRHCENEALSCTIGVVSNYDRGEIEYRAGEIVAVTLNGEAGQDAIVDIVHFTTGTFRIVAPPLSFDIEGWPSIRDDPTVPFRISRHAEAFRPDGDPSEKASEDENEAAVDDKKAVEDDKKAAEDDKKAAEDDKKAVVDDKGPSLPAEREAETKDPSPAPAAKGVADSSAPPSKPAEKTAPPARQTDSPIQKADHGPGHSTARTVEAHEPALQFFPLVALLAVSCGLTLIFWMYVTGGV